MKLDPPANQTNQAIVYHLVMNPLQPRYVEPTVATTPQTGEPMGKKGSDVGMIVGIVVGVIALLLLIALVLLLLRRSQGQPKLINRDIE